MCLYQYQLYRKTLDNIQFNENLYYLKSKIAENEIKRAEIILRRFRLKKRIRKKRLLRRLKAMNLLRRLRRSVKQQSSPANRQVKVSLSLPIRMKHPGRSGPF